MFKENTESRLYRDFLNKWKKTWTAAELDESEDEDEENCMGKIYVKEKRRSSKQRYRKSKKIIALDDI